MFASVSASNIQRNSNYDCLFLYASAQTDYYSIYSFPPALCCRPSPVFLYRNKKRTLSSTGNIARHHAPSLFGAESTAVYSYCLISILSIIFLIIYNIASINGGRIETWMKEEGHYILAA